MLYCLYFYKDRKDYQQVCKVINCVQLKQTLADFANLFCCRNVLKHVQAPHKNFTHVLIASVHSIESIKLILHWICLFMVNKKIFV